MTTSTPSATQLFTKVAKPRDFSDLVQFGSTEELFKLKRELHLSVKTAPRTPMLEVLKERLKELRASLKMCTN